MIGAMIFSVIFIAEESKHNCTENDCQICYQINSCLTVLNTISPKPAFYAMAVLSCCFVALIVFLHDNFNNKESLVSLKVKLSN